MSKFISKFPAKSGKKPSHSRLLKPDSGWSPKRNDARRSRDTMNSVGIPWTQWGHLWKSTFSSWKSSLMKTKLIFNRIISCFKQSYFSGVFHLLAEFQNWNVWGNLQNIKNDVKKIRQCVRCMNISPKKKSYGTTQKMPKKNTHSLPPPISSPGHFTQPQRFLHAFRPEDERSWTNWMTDPHVYLGYVKRRMGVWRRWRCRSSP